MTTPSWPLPAEFVGSGSRPLQPVDDDAWPRPRSGREGLRVLGSGGRYQLRGILTPGGQASIWTAWDAVRMENVVVKTPHPVPVPSDMRTAERRMVREARILRMLAANQWAVELLDWGPQAFRSESGDLPPDGEDVDGLAPARHPWLVLRWYSHSQLGQVLKRSGPFESEPGTAFARDLASALATLHGAGVVHRDLSPGNVLLTTTGLRLADLGVAWCERYVDDGVETAVSQEVTRLGGRALTPGWAAPEVVRIPDGAAGRDPAADVYCWGLMAFAALTGRHPWLSTGRGLYLEADDLDRMQNSTRGRPEFRRDDIAHKPLRDLVFHALDPTPRGRPDADAIVRGLAETSSPGRRKSARLNRVDTTLLVREAASQLRPRRERRRRISAVAIASLVAVAGAGAAVTFGDEIGGATQPPPATAGPAPTQAGDVLLVSDDFSSPTLDTGKWVAPERSDVFGPRDGALHMTSDARTGGADLKLKPRDLGTFTAIEFTLTVAAGFVPGPGGGGLTVSDTNGIPNRLVFGASPPGVIGAAGLLCSSPPCRESVYDDFRESGSTAEWQPGKRVAMRLAREGADLVMYADGIEVGRIAQPRDLVRLSFDMQADPDERWDLALDDIRIYGRTGA